jgi:hypothetical protein
MISKCRGSCVTQLAATKKTLISFNFLPTGIDLMLPYTSRNLLISQFSARHIDIKPELGRWNLKNDLQIILGD